MPVNEKPSVASEVAGPPGPNVEELFSDGPVVLFVWKPKPGWPVEYVSRNVVGQLGYSPVEILAPSCFSSDRLHPVLPMDISVSEITRNGRMMFNGVIRDITERTPMERVKTNSWPWSPELRTPLVRQAIQLSRPRPNPRPPAPKTVPVWG